VVRRDQRDTNEASVGGIHNDATCPVCDGLMISLPNGARCADCGVRERILSVEER
jgi:tRNA(Ile2) C34 agmatinyltransferase TiaS